jgi:hypothetical protein
LSGETRTFDPASYWIGEITRESESEEIDELVEDEEFLHAKEGVEELTGGEQICTIWVFSHNAVSLTAPQNFGR